MAGLAAAARSVQLGASVMLVEKGARTGGSAVHAEFIWTAPTLEVLRTVNPLGDERLAERLLVGRRPALDGCPDAHQDRLRYVPEDSPSC